LSVSIWDTAVIALKAITYAGALGAAGAVFFLGYGRAFILSAERPRIRHVVLCLSTLSVIAGGAQILVTAGSMSGEAAGMLDGSLIHMTWQAGAGRSNEVRAIGLFVAALGVSSNRVPWWAFCGASIAATSFAWTGHARSLEPDMIPILLIGIHLLGVAFWIGALTPLLIISRNNDLSRIAAAAARFGRAALFAVGGLITAGAGLLWMLLGDLTALWTSSYGRYVMLKLAFVGCLLCFAAFNKLRLTPRLLAGDFEAIRSLRTSIRLEVLLAFLILAVTAALTTLEGPPALG
jgi:putative copper resistance protein D